MAADLPGTTVSGCVDIRRDETIETAELLAGGFNGWFQASYVISRSQRPVRVRFSLDRDTRCAECAAYTHPGVCVVDDPQQLQASLPKDLDLFVVGDIDQRWWVPALAKPSIEAWMVSPPCQPFSTASSGPGVFAQDGKALLHVLALAEVLKRKCICIEQVQGFVRHPHFGFLRAIWESLGYKAVWQGSFDLRDVAPSSRMRFLIILARSDIVPATPISSSWPVLGPRPSLGSFACLVDLPPALKAP